LRKPILPAEKALFFAKDTLLSKPLKMGRAAPSADAYEDLFTLRLQWNLLHSMLVKAISLEVRNHTQSSTTKQKGFEKANRSEEVNWIQRYSSRKKPHSSLLVCTVEQGDNLCVIKDSGYVPIHFFPSPCSCSGSAFAPYKNQDHRARRAGNGGSG
jgi:hypothetical protein